jgi:ankyrin repeat protein
MTSVASSTPDTRHLELLQAAAQANEGLVRDLLSADPPWTSHVDRDVLRQSLQRVSARGFLPLASLLLEHGAEPNTRRGNEIPALTKAVEIGHVAIVAELLSRGADTHWCNPRNGQTALFAACMKGYNEVVRMLLEGGAAVDAKDKEGRTPLFFLASSKPGKWNTETLRLLVAFGANIECRDSTERTPLLWAATTGNAMLAKALLSGELGKSANLMATNKRGISALQLACEDNHVEVVKILLSYKADARAVSSGGWTALHNSCQNGHLGVVAALLEPSVNVNINAELSNGMTPCHWAAYNGHVEVVKLLLTRPDLDISIKDNLYRTPMLCAAETFNKEIVQLLSPARCANRLPYTADTACRQFEATVVDFGEFRDGKKTIVHKEKSVHEVLYGWDEETGKPTIPTLTKNIKHQPSFRWIHLPANNVIAHLRFFLLSLYSFPRI